MKDSIVAAGATVKIVMVSRLGDVGITDRLDTDHGYGCRIGFDEFDTYFADRRNSPEPSPKTSEPQPQG
jgi:hypothetical protein